MFILVSDTSVLVDLERGSLLTTAFGCGLNLVVPDLLYMDELEAFNGPYLRSLGLGVLSLGPDELQLVQEVRNQRPMLSLSDSFALVLAIRDQHALLTGDRHLRREGSARGVQVYGLLWLMDQMETCGVDSSLLYQGLSSICNDVRCRLPKEDVAHRLKRWAN